jgi:hypothetical protein
MQPLLNELKECGREKPEQAFANALQMLTSGEYEVDLEQLWPTGPYIRISFLTKKKDAEEDTRD